MNMSLRTEQTIAGLILLLLLGCCIQEKVASQQLETEDRFGEYLSGVRESKDTLTDAIVQKEAFDRLSSQDLELNARSLEPYVDHRFGFLKKAHYLPSHQTIRYYDNSKLAVRNRRIELIFDTAEGEKSTIVQKIEVYVRRNGRWVLKDEPMEGVFAKL